MKAESTSRPEGIQDLGDGTYFKNTNVVESVVDGVTFYNYDQEKLEYVNSQVPYQVPNWALVTVLEIAGLTTTIEAVIEQIPDKNSRITARNAWKMANYIVRTSPMLADIIAVLQLTEQQADDFFIAADKLFP